MSTQPTEDTIIDEVQAHYARLADTFDGTTSAACCSTSVDDPGCGAELYNPDLIEDLPFDVTGMSLGCGDPVTIAGLEAGQRVLDLGSGAGIDCFLAARQVGPTGYVIGVDMTPSMLAKADANKAQMGVTNVEFREGRIEALPVADADVDVVMSNCVINLVPDKLAAFKEAHRVLRPGGQLSISDIVTDGDFDEEMKAKLDLWAGCVSGAIDMHKYIGLMEEAGFVDVTVREKSESVDVRDGDETPRAFSARITASKPSA
ncbi:MAG: arsenite methyltransferase [Chloroflexi bacterium]|nr:arsenite methyltransferase [Chloroflexota bacterium]